MRFQSLIHYENKMEFNIIDESFSIVSNDIMLFIMALFRGTIYSGFCSLVNLHRSLVCCFGQEICVLIWVTINRAVCLFFADVYISFILSSVCHRNAPFLSFSLSRSLSLNK